ncbi:putative GNAT superfamily acetyltransferase [Streptomyces sp. B3I7]|uniref:GNAT family N-acetyltransferase n=1 Tax=Streptomyces sp. B3I7 TaxID=3042269 RepID=UPI00278A286A|nr:GNAT family N-acetyltransferase [Streptomyces sp. B3I7]MDQ0815310.1 putative GNAT superfamily acetyltransferase [Streptomyces sp. B3I7]
MTGHGPRTPGAASGPSPSVPAEAERTTAEALRTLAEAEHAAAEAARDAKVTVRELTEVADLAAVSRLLRSVWRSEPGNGPVPSELLRAMTVAGNYVSGAFDGDGGELLGACFGFFGAPAHGSLHSHITGVLPAGLGRGLGLALKLHQRAWSLRRGADTISWTFDPLVCRNAHFNLAKLGARPVRYVPDFYGPLHDGINGAGATDRLLVDWDLTGAAGPGSRAPVDAAALRAGGAVPALSAGADGRPVTGADDGPVLLVAVPPDIEELRRTDPELGRAWRPAVREVLGGLMAEGAEVTGFDRAGWYVVERKRDS